MDAAWTKNPSDDAHRARLETSARLARVESHDLEVAAESSSEGGRLSFFFIPSPPLQSRLSPMLPPLSPAATAVASPAFPSASLLGSWQQAVAGPMRASGRWRKNQEQDHNVTLAVEVSVC
ncbi:hypothetical protein E2562_020685 [Oryza meyeriana var. granulata]|uniref:Uncharacterized protein n=1 Tax=Oryza meyeriana var. granulata TaxID=110450 RepID=A0A6G1EMZ0_9ORYZ|nr:hypothetical protein E2562_020685 [Oryza meyeriana var. granulata]